VKKSVDSQRGWPKKPRSIDAASALLPSVLIGVLISKGPQFEVRKNEPHPWLTTEQIVGRVASIQPEAGYAVKPLECGVVSY